MDLLDDDALGLVLERIGSQVSLIRGAATCKQWRRIIANAAFLRRFRTLHPATIAGTYHNDSPTTTTGEEARESRGPVFVPSPSMSIDSRYYSLDFLPDGGAKAWFVADSRGGLLLMRAHYSARCSLIVCEPLTRRYRKIPPPPGLRYIQGYYLVDGPNADDVTGRISMWNFQVFFEAYVVNVPYAVVVFTVRDGISSWSERAIDDHIAPKHCAERVLGSVAGSRFIYLEGGTLAALDCTTGDFSSSQLPATEYSWDLRPFSFRAVDGHDGKPRIVTLFLDEVKVFVRIGSENWKLEKSVRLAEIARGLPGYQPSFFDREMTLVTRGPGFIILFLRLDQSIQWSFSLNLETMEVAPASSDLGPTVHQCKLPWPPALHT